MFLSLDQRVRRGARVFVFRTEKEVWTMGKALYNGSRWLCLLVVVGLLMPACAGAPFGQGTTTAAPRDVLLMASTIGPIDAGIVGALEDAYFAKTGVLVRHAGAGTGAALEMTKRGGFDLVMVHARALEDKFVADGFGVDRRDVMYNDFVILGPVADPAGIKGEKQAINALRKIAQTQTLFVTRGDNSGTHVKELELWQKAGIKPAEAWYVTYEKGASGNAPTTRYANERRAYVLMDRATYLTFKKEIGLQVLVEKDPDLLNYIAVIRMNPAKFPKANAAGAKTFLDWLVSDEAQRLIKSFGVSQYGESLFFPNSDHWRRKNPS
jgi:tungstate transport system substrate-binding protein